MKDRWGGRRYVLCWGVLLITSALLAMHRLTPDAYAEILIATVAAYITGNVMQRHIEARAGATDGSTR